IEAATREEVILVDRVLSRAETLMLMNSADCYVSLHRSEGVGLTLAEAMLLGKPVIATAYSGNLDFMNRGNSLLVDYRRTRLEEDAWPYPKGSVWAEPSIEHAAELMRWVIEHPAEANALGEQARRDLRELMSLEAYGQRLAAALWT